MAGKNHNYLLEVELSEVVNGAPETSLFQFLLLVTQMGDAGQSDMGSIYQIEIEQIDLQLSKNLKKANDFIKRVNYVNDGIKIKVNTKGVVMAVENQKELQSNWKELHKLLAHEYTGEVVKEYLIEIDERLNDPVTILHTVYTYLNFGLIFPHIPPKHGAVWENRRQIALSEYEVEMLEEYIRYVGEQEEARRYDVSLFSAPEQQMVVEYAAGYIVVEQDEILPSKALIEISYLNRTINNKWKFKLKQY